jgi:hypothetical protein
VPATRPDQGILGNSQTGVRKNRMQSMIRFVISGIVASAGAFAASPGFATDLFQINVDVTTPTVATGAVGFNTITDIANSLTDSGLQSIVAAYNPNTSAASATLNIRGVTAIATYANGSATLRFQVPSAGIDISFAGATRDDSQTQFKNFLLKNGGSLMTQLLQDVVAGSPVDPVAGNPSSLQNSMAAADFNIGTGIGLQGSEIPGGGGNAGLLGQPNLVSAGGDVGVINSGGYTSTVVSLPIRYTIPLADPRYAVTIDLPLTWVDTQGANSAFASLGVSLRIPVLTNWYITPGVRGGVAGSIDLGAAAIQYSGSVASRYDVYLHDLDITVGNAVAVAKTAPLSVGSVSVNYDLTNELFTNGLQVEGSLPYTIFGDPTSWQTYFADTYVTGSKVYVDHYDEVGFTLGTRHGRNGQDWNSLRLGAGFTFGAHYTAYKAGFTYRF